MVVVTSIRIPDEIYIAFKERAKRNDRSLNKEIVRLMRLELEKEQKGKRWESRSSVNSVERKER